MEHGEKKKHRRKEYTIWGEKYTTHKEQQAKEIGTIFALYRWGAIMQPITNKK